MKINEKKIREADERNFFNVDDVYPGIDPEQLVGFGRTQISPAYVGSVYGEDVRTRFERERGSPELSERLSAELPGSARRSSERR